MKYLDELNEAQARAVKTLEGPVLVLAGAGAGKTKTITYRILNLIQNGVEPSSILAVTFTNKAAREMQERISKLLEEGREVGKPFVSTFHGLGAYIIKEHAGLVGRTRHFSIYDRGDSKRAVKEALEKKGLNPKEFEPNKILGAISREKGNFITASEYSGGGDYFGEIIAEVWQEYEEVLKKENALDFDDLLLLSAKLLEREEIRELYSLRWKYVHIDEYQDTNKVQYQIAKFLVSEHSNICAVGDIDQNIYSWRGANIRNILNFERDYPSAKLVVLEENYRSTQTILAVANRAIEKNKLRREKILVTRNGIGEKISIFEALDENHEANFVVEKILDLRKKGIELREIAVLYRANFQSRVLEESCLSHNLPYHVLGTKFFERKEIKDIISYLRYAFNPDSIGDLKRIINTPARGIGKTTLLKIVEGKESDLPPKMKINLANFRALLERIKKYALEHKLSHTIKFIAEESGILKEIASKEEEVDREENIKELTVLASRYDTDEDNEGMIEKFLEDVSLASDQDSDKESVEAVRLMTVHASKGLEFSYVFIVGLEEGLFPHDRDFNEKVSEEEAEEERRLFYVALTRAKKKLFLSYANSRSVYGRSSINIPSEFILEIPEEYTEKEFLDYTRRRKPLLHIEF